MNTIHIARYVGFAAVVLLGACSTPADPVHVRKDSRSICRPGDPYCQSNKPVLDENGDMVRGLPKQ